MIAAAAAALLLLSHIQVIPPLDNSWTLVAWAVLLLGTGLALAPVFAAAQRASTNAIGKAQAQREKMKASEAFKQRFKDYLPYLTDKERAIFGYLLKHKQKHFTADLDGGNAAGLMAQQFVIRIGVAGQAFDYDEVPMGVPDKVWEVLEEQPETFRYKPEMSGSGRDAVEFHPWRQRKW
jgi:hypothetical protein